MSDEIRTDGKMVEDQLLEAIQFDLQAALELLAKNGSALSGPCTTTTIQPCIGQPWGVNMKLSKNLYV